MKKMVTMVFATLAVGVVFSATTAHLMLDTRKGARIADATEEICFSSAWETAVVGASVTVSLDGVAVTNAIGEGVFEWAPTRNGTYTFAHSVSVGGVPVGETMNATFVVEGKDVPVSTVTTHLALDTRNRSRTNWLRRR